jgi:hypothetical protein
MFAYLAIVITAVAAYFGAPIWAAAPTTLALLTLSLVEHRKLQANSTLSGTHQPLTTAALQSGVHAVAAGGAAYVLGMVCRVAFPL